ncbi:hypothetical protein JAAARDRAFT_128661 [Jaapia argillacea MUCL 33604]|uniref:NADH:flavin oxidoreductase/NADH oxidase N-terminal domain-containing protein n=1 Tax=Jaapia argillacea MUCL 33604 TaxID=933084 RepID=A0A067Q6W8_9AGAM|nr:hypothetical protein JAAARDRAFT_128661 [Jaapia argillacea MUCL 33604]
MTTYLFNKLAPGIPYFTPAQVPASGTAVDPQPDGKTIPKLFQPLKIRGVEFQNRIFLSPLRQFSADGGKLTPWHMAHLGGIFTRGPGLSFVEATAVLPEGRGTAEDAGLWADDQIEPMRKIVEFAHSQNQKIGIQLSHTGYDHLEVVPWFEIGHEFTDLSRDCYSCGTTRVCPGSSIACEFVDKLINRLPLKREGIKRIVAAFVASAVRALKAGFDVIEIHASHGYLLDYFMSPFANHRTDEYGGSFENRIRFTLEVVDAVRAIIPSSMPLFIRVSATEWLGDAAPTGVPTWTLEDTVKLAGILADHGVDFIDVSGGIPSNEALYPATSAIDHSQFSAAVKKVHGSKIVVGSVGGYVDGHTANAVVEQDKADVILVGRGFQKNPGLVWSMADDLGIRIHNAHQIEWGFMHAMKKISQTNGTNGVHVAVQEAKASQAGGTNGVHVTVQQAKISQTNGTNGTHATVQKAM